uniref:tRNA pseudouridine(55) synthase n=1 Tax=Aceria tosichella TaxID=561515 RepID=A0A6G1SBK9_9ACAR
MSTEIIHLAGRYNKYRRNLSQSPWIDKNDIRVMNSVQEMIEDGLKKYLSFDKSVFASSGREDVDVRMLGKGRPFAFKLHNPRNLEQYNEQTLKLIEKFVNEKHAGSVSVRDLQIVDKKDVTKNLSDEQSAKKKMYRALCCCSRKLTDDDINRINSLSEICLNQQTPIRVLHRRSLATRKRTIHDLKIEPVKLGDFESVKLEYMDNMFAVSMLTEAGTYIKEFVHGDFGRTEPSLSSLLQDCDTDLMELDVMEVHSDWPPSLQDNTNSHDTMSTGTSLAYQDDKSGCGDEALAELYSRGLKTMQEALEMSRGDKKEDLLVTSRRSLEKADNLVDSLAMFSDNETIDDIPTANLKYLLIPAYLAKLSISGEIRSRRLEAFCRAETYIRQFLHRMSTYSFGGDQVREALKSIDKPDDESKPAPKSLEDQARIRREKIEKFNRTKELENKLAELERRLESTVDDEVVREYYIDLIHKWIIDIIDDLEGIIKPALMFERGAAAGTLMDRPEPVRRPGGSEASSSSNSLVGKNFVITKDMLTKQVFGAGYPSLATVSVDEFITKKINDGDLVYQKDKEIYSNSLQRYAEQPDLLREQEEHSDEEREAKEERDDQEELARKRRWDEFKDDTPRGSGNRHNMG